jgi:hypothetical protein
MVDSYLCIHFLLSAKYILHTKNTTEFLIYHCNNNILKPRNYNLTGFMYDYVDYFVKCYI